MDFKSNEHPEARARKLSQLAKDVASAGDASASAAQALAAAAQAEAARAAAQGFSATAQAAAATVGDGVSSASTSAAAALASRNQSAQFAALSDVARGLADQAKIDAEQALTAGQGARDQAVANALASSVSAQNALGSATAGAASATIATSRATESEIAATSATAQANLARLSANESGTNAAAAALTSTSSAVRATEAGVSASAALASQLQAEIFRNDASGFATASNNSSATAAAAATAAGQSASTSTAQAAIATAKAGESLASAGNSQTFATSAQAARDGSLANAAAANASRLSADVASASSQSASTTAQASSVSASNAAAAAATSASLSASVGLNALNREPNFSSYLISGPVPLGWINQAGPNNFQSVAGEIGGRAVRRAAAAKQESFVYSDPRFRTQKDQYHILEGWIRLESGSLVGSGLIVIWEDEEGNDLGERSSVRFDTDIANNTGAAIGAGVAGQYYRFSALRRAASNVNVSSGKLYWMNHWSGFTSIALANDITWYRVAALPASASQIRDSTILTPLVGSVATHDTQISALATENAAQARSISNISTQVGSNFTTQSNQISALSTAQAAQATNIAALSATSGTQTANISALQTVSADSASKLAEARLRLVAAASGSTPARLELSAGAGGSAAQIAASQIFFGDNTVFTDATDILETVVAGGVVNSIAYGAPFGQNGDLLQWFGPDGIAVNLRNKMNAYFFTSSVPPLIGGSQFAGSAYQSVTMSLINASGVYSVTGTVDLLVPAGRNIVVSSLISYRPSGSGADEDFFAQSRLRLQNLTDGGPNDILNGSETIGSRGEYIAADGTGRRGFCNSTGSFTTGPVTKTYRAQLETRKFGGSATGLQLQTGKLEISAR